MKKVIVASCLSLALIFSVTVSAYADGYSRWDNLTPGQAGYVLIQLLASQTGNYVYNVNCNASSYAYSVTVSYDSLSDICSAANGVGMTCSLFYNYHADVYVIAVDDRTTLGLSGTNGVIGNPDGYIYVANDPDAGQEESNRYLWNIMYANQSIFKLLDYIEREVLSGTIVTKLTELRESVNNLIQTNALLSNIIRYLDVLADDLETDDSPLLTRLDSIKTAIGNATYDDGYLLDILREIDSKLSNLTINADNLENLTIDAYDDTALIDIVSTGLMYWENMDLGIQALNNTLTGTNNPFSRVLSSMKSRLDDIYNEAASIRGLLYNTQSPSVLSYLKDISASLSQLSKSGNEVPETIYDYISMRLVPLQVSLGNNVSLLVNTTSSISTKLSTLSDTATSISGVATENNTILSRMDTNLATLTSSIDSIAYAVGTGGLQGRTLMSLLDSVNTRVEAVRKAVVTLSPYDDTNVIAAVNSVEAALSNLSFSGEVNTDLTPVITSIDAVGVNIEDLNANFNTSLGSLVDKLDVIVDNSSESVENLTVEISVDNDAHNVFYVTDEDGNEESLVDFSGDVLKAGGKLLNFLFKVCFDGAIDNLDGSIDDMDSFYFDGAELGGSLWE